MTDRVIKALDSDTIAKVMDEIGDIVDNYELSLVEVIAIFEQLKFNALTHAAYGDDEE